MKKNNTNIRVLKLIKKLDETFTGSKFYNELKYILKNQSKEKLEEIFNFVFENYILRENHYEPILFFSLASNDKSFLVRKESINIFYTEVSFLYSKKEKDLINKNKFNIPEKDLYFYFLENFKQIYLVAINFANFNQDSKADEYVNFLFEYLRETNKEYGIFCLKRILSKNSNNIILKI